MGCGERREVFSGDGMSGIEKCGSVCGDNDKMTNIKVKRKRGLAADRTVWGLKGVEPKDVRYA